MFVSHTGAKYVSIDIAEIDYTATFSSRTACKCPYSPDYPIVVVKSGHINSNLSSIVTV